jgi:hypothetical protein
MHHPYPVFDEAFLKQIAAQLSKQRDELNRLRRAVKAASPRPDEKSNPWTMAVRAYRLRLSFRPRATQTRDKARPLPNVGDPIIDLPVRWRSSGKMRS